MGRAGVLCFLGFQPSAGGPFKSEFPFGELSCMPVGRGEAKCEGCEWGGEGTRALVLACCHVMLLHFAMITLLAMYSSNMRGKAST